MCPLLSNMRSRLLGGGRLAVPVPTLGAEFLVNGDFETWASATDAGSWTEGVVGASTVNRDNLAPYAGTYACRFDIDGSNSGVQVTQGSLTAGTWYLMTMYAKASAGTPWVRFGGSTAYRDNVPLTTSYAQYCYVFRPGVGESILIRRVTTAGVSLYFDNASVKTIPLASMFSTRPYSTHCTTKAKATIVASTRAGVVANLDSATSPANFVIASHDGTTARLTKCVAGTYTELVSTSVTYVAGAYVEIRRLAGTDTWQLWYNGSQVGTNQTISDAAIKAATLCGYFNTYAGNTLTDFSCVPSV